MSLEGMKGVFFCFCGSSNGVNVGNFSNLIDVNMLCRFDANIRFIIIVCLGKGDIREL